MIDTIGLTQSVNLRDMILADTEEGKAGHERVYCSFCQKGGSVANNAPAMMIRDKHYYCYGCGAHGDAIDYVMQRGGLDFFTACKQLGWQGEQPSRDELKRRQAEHEAARQLAKLKHDEEVDRILSTLQTEDIIAGYHRRLTAEHREWWERRGVTAAWQDYLRLGFNADKKYYGNDGILYSSSAYVIPYFRDKFALKTIQYRLNNPQRPQDRYRFENGLPTTWYEVEPGAPLGDQAVICEGAIKAMVTRLYGGIRDDVRIYGVPGKTSWCGIAEHVKPCGRVWVILDPDGTREAISLARKIGKAAKVIQLPMKIDDALNSGALTQAGLKNYFLSARRIDA